MKTTVEEHLRELYGGATATVHEAMYDGRATEHQSRADQAYQSLGLRAPARVVGEPIVEYRRRLLAPLVQHSPQWQKVTVNTLSGPALDVAEETVFADAVTAATRTGAGTGPLREIVHTDESGRRIKRFYGDPEFTWAPFKLPARAVIGFPCVRS
jgi:hypothetical protein